MLFSSSIDLRFSGPGSRRDGGGNERTVVKVSELLTKGAIDAFNPAIEFGAARLDHCCGIFGCAHSSGFQRPRSKNGLRAIVQIVDSLGSRPQLGYLIT